MRNRVCKGQPRGAKQEGQGMALRANGAGLGPVIHWLWATGRGGVDKRQIQGEMTVRSSGPRVRCSWWPRWDIRRGSEGDAHLGGKMQMDHTEFAF